MADNKVSQSSGFSAPGSRGPMLYTKSADRTMSCHLVTDSELRALERSGNNAVLSFAIGSWVLGYGVDWFIEWQVNDYKPAVGEMLLCFFVAVAFFIWGLKSRKDAKGIADEIRQSEPR